MIQLIWHWKWLPHRLSKRQSLSTTKVLFRTTFSRTIKLNLILKWLLGSNLSQFYKLTPNNFSLFFYDNLEPMSDWFQTLVGLVTYNEQNYSATRRGNRITMLDASAYRFNKIREFCFILSVCFVTRMSPSALQQLKCWLLFICLVLEQLSKQMRGNLSFCPNSHQLVSSDIDNECKLTYCFRNYSMISCKTGKKCM